MFQVIPSQWGHPGNTPRSQAKKTEAILRELISSSGGKLHVALAKYNAGSNWRGRKGQQYASAVLALVRKV